MNYNAAIQQLSRSIDLRGMNIQRGQIYDTAWMPAATSSGPVEFFSVGAGSADPNSSVKKTSEETNLSRTGDIGNRMFLAMSLRTFLYYEPKLRQPANMSGDADGLYKGYEPLMATYINYLNGGTLTIEVGQKDAFEIDVPFKTCPPGFGVTVKSMAAVATEGLWVTQSPKSKVYELKPFQLLQQHERISAKLEWPDTTSPVLTSIYTENSGATPKLCAKLILDGLDITPQQ